MFETENDPTLLPTELDKARLAELKPDGRVEGEHRTWVLLRYPPNPAKGWRWCEYSLLVNCDGLPPRPAPYELKTMGAVLALLGQLEMERKHRRKKL